MFIVNLNTLRFINFLYLIYKVTLRFTQATYTKDIMRID